jgi:hypothetical protein
MGAFVDLRVRGVLVAGAQGFSELPGQRLTRMSQKEVRH